MQIIGTMQRLAAAAGVPLLPVTEDTLQLLLETGGYRAGPAYLGVLKQAYTRSGHDAVAERKSSAPPRQMELLDVVLVGSMWMLGRAEFAALL